MTMLGPLFDQKGVVLMQDTASNGKFMRVGYGHNDGKRDRWWVYEPGGSTATSFRAPGFARPSQSLRYRYVADWPLSTWISKIQSTHSDHDELPDGHPHSPGIPHKGSTDFTYIKGEFSILDTLPATVAAMLAEVPSPPSPNSCPSGSSPEIDPGFLRIRPIGQETVLGYVFVPTGTNPATNVFQNVEYWMLIDDGAFPRPSSSSSSGFEVIQRKNITGPATLDQSVIDFFAANWVSGSSSLTIVTTRWYSCRLADADL